LANGRILFISEISDIEYRALVEKDQIIFECTVTLNRALGFQNLDVVCIGEKIEE